jgi:hypothetical protein
VAYPDREISEQDLVAKPPDKLFDQDVAPNRASSLVEFLEQFLAQRRQAAKKKTLLRTGLA